MMGIMVLPAFGVGGASCGIDFATLLIQLGLIICSGSISIPSSPENYPELPGLLAIIFP
jgi:hypothetical protein